MDPAQLHHLEKAQEFRQPMQKAIAFPTPSGISVIYECPGCKNTHSVPADRWHWNGDVMKPTLSPSVRHFIPADGKHFPHDKTTCHYFVRDGRIEFCSDSPHALAGQTVDLPDIDPAEYSAT